MRKKDADVLVEQINQSLQSDKEIIPVSEEEKASMDSAQNLYQARVLQVGELFLSGIEAIQLALQAREHRSAQLREIVAAHGWDPNEPNINFDVGQGVLWRFR